MDNSYRQDFIKAGACAREVRAYGKSLITPGASYNQVIAAINQKIHDLGARPAFPPQIALDDVAAHFLPEPGQDILFSDQVIKLDVGVSYKGAIGDCAVTIDLSGKQQVLIDAAEAALLAAEEIIKVGLPLRAIGKTIENTAASFGLSPVRNLCGHGLARFKIHTSPSIPNCDNRATALVRPGMTFAIEPFVTNGVGMIYETGEAAIFSYIADRRVRSDLAKTLLAKIASFDRLPFAIHALITPELPLSTVRQGLKELMEAGAIVGYPPLVEQSHGLVAQAENSVLVDTDGTVLITTR